MSARRRSPAYTDEAGATAVETAILLPVLVTLLVAILELGWAFHCGSTVRWAVERSARSFLLRPDATATEVRADVLSNVRSLTGRDDLELTFFEEEPEPGRRMARVLAVYRHRFVVPFTPVRDLRFQSQTVVPLAMP